jgi:Tannase and feruloyl esterase
MRAKGVCGVGLMLCWIAGSSPALAQSNCEKLKELQLADTTITGAESVTAGPFKLPPGLIPSVDVPAFCRVRGEIKPTADSLIKMEVWMPAEGWNGKFEQVGNGGLAGSINQLSLALALQRGFATAGTDDGHEGAGTDGSWALGHPEKVKDFGYRAVHETSEKSKKIIAAFYQRAASFAYFNGCSEGGREAMMEAQRYPDDFNGILAGAPALYWTQLMTAFVWNAQALSDPASFINEPKRAAVENAALAACGRQNNVTDKFIKDPLQCHFDPALLLCKEGDGDSCLTQKQVDALKKVYGGPKDSSGKQLSAGYEPGAEAEPGLPGISYQSYILGPGPGATLDAIFSGSFYSSFVFEDPKWKVAQFNFDKDVVTTEAKVGGILNAGNPDLRGFRSHGGKLLVYHGWNDGSPPPLHSVEYYQRVAEKIGGVEKTREFYRMFMVPGMMHCGLGPGPNLFGNAMDLRPIADPEHDIFMALQSWVEKGLAPEHIVATKYVEDDPSKGKAMTRPVCAYPQQAKWDGKGDLAEAGSWVCDAGK